MQVPKDSKMPLDWIQRACTQNPVAKLTDPTSGQFVGNYSTGPVRLAWTKDLIVPKKTEKDQDRWGCTVLFPAVDLSLLVQASNEAAARDWPENMTAAGFNWAGLVSPWSDQLAKASKYAGYTPGCWTFNVGTYFKPRIVDTNMNDIPNLQERLYAGVWAILAVNCYPYGKGAKGPVKKGVGFGLQSTVLIADDTPFGGTGLDPRAAFRGINIASNVNPAAAFGSIMPPTSGPAAVTDLDKMRALGLL